MKPAFSDKFCSKNVKNQRSKDGIVLKGSSISLAERDKARSRPSSRPASALSKSKSHNFPWRRPASADFSIQEPARTLCRSTSSKISPRKAESALAICQRAGFCGSDVLADETSRRQHRLHFSETCYPDAEWIDPDLMKYAYTAESARLLQTLLREPWRSDESESNSSSARSRLGAKNHIFSKSHEFLNQRTSEARNRQLLEDSCLHGLTSSKHAFLESQSNNCAGNSCHSPYCVHSSENLLKKHSKLEERSQFLRLNPHVPPPSPEFKDIGAGEGPKFSYCNDTLEMGRKYLLDREKKTEEKNRTTQKSYQEGTNFHGGTTRIDSDKKEHDFRGKSPDRCVSRLRNSDYNQENRNLPLYDRRSDVKFTTENHGKLAIAPVGKNFERVDCWTEKGRTIQQERRPSSETITSKDGNLTTDQREFAQAKNTMSLPSNEKLPKKSSYKGILENKTRKMPKNNSMEQNNLPKRRSPCEVRTHLDIETEICHHSLESNAQDEDNSIRKTTLDIIIGSYEKSKDYSPRSFGDASPRAEKIGHGSKTKDCTPRAYDGPKAHEIFLASENKELSPNSYGGASPRAKNSSPDSPIKFDEAGSIISSARVERMQFSDNFFVDNLDAAPKESQRTGSTLCLRDLAADTAKHLTTEVPKSVRFDQASNDECLLIDLTEEKSPHLPTKVLTPRDSTLEDIENIIQVLENSETKSETTVQPPDVSETFVPKETSKSKEIFQYLDQVEPCTEPVKTTRKASVVAEFCESSVPRMEELLCRSAVDLAQEVLNLRLQAEEQAGGIRLLQQTVAEVKESAKAEKAAHQLELANKSNEGEAALVKQQKLTKQLLAEKKTLNDKLAEVINELKTSEERHQRNLKAQEERHLIEIQRVKETHAAAEKLKREKWIDVKTQKIKEMTVKGLEPELARMAARQQQELQELRNLHRGELEAVELKAARRTTELMDELRAELSRDKEEAIQREGNLQRIKWEKRLEDEVRIHEDETKRLKDDLRRERDRLNALENHVQEQLLEARRSSERERERERTNVIREWEEKIETLQRQHQIELKNLKEALEMEKDVWMSNFKKIQAKKYLDKETDLHHHYKRERDREIEIAIEKLETEATKARLELTEAAESKLHRLREKLTGEIKDLESEVATLKAKLSDARQQIADKEDEFLDAKARLRQSAAEHAQVTKLCEEMSSERSDLRRVLQAELQQQLNEAQETVEAIKKEIAELKTQHAVELVKKDQIADQIRVESEAELQSVHNRVKTVIKKKEEALEAQKEQYRVVLERCSHLESMLENQRKNLLLQ